MTRRAFVDLSDTFESWRQKSNSLASYVGEPDDLLTSTDNDLVSAINEVYLQTTDDGIREKFTLNSTGAGDYVSLQYLSATGEFSFVANALAATDIPNLDAGKITTGTFNSNTIPGLDASIIVTGILDSSVIPAGVVGTGSGSISTSDNLTEGTTNLYYTNTRARASLSSVSDELSFNASNGQFTFNGLASSAIGSGLALNSGVISAIDATNTVKGSAKFDADYFTLTSGLATIADGSLDTVKIKDAAVTIAKIASGSISEAADYRSNASGKILTTDAVYNSLVVVALTDAITLALNLSTGINFTLTIGGNRTLQNPSVPKTGQCGHIAITQDATGSRTLNFDSRYVFAGGIAPTLTSAPGSVDILFYQVLSATKTFISMAGDVK